MYVSRCSSDGSSSVKGGGSGSGNFNGHSGDSDIVGAVTATPVLKVSVVVGGGNCNYNDDNDDDGNDNNDDNNDDDSKMFMSY